MNIKILVVNKILTNNKSLNINNKIRITLVR